MKYTRCEPVDDFTKIPEEEVDSSTDTLYSGTSDEEVSVQLIELYLHQSDKVYINLE